MVHVTSRTPSGVWCVTSSSLPSTPTRDPRSNRVPRPSSAVPHPRSHDDRGERDPNPSLTSSDPVPQGRRVTSSCPWTVYRKIKVSRPCTTATTFSRGRTSLWDNGFSVNSTHRVWGRKPSRLAPRPLPWLVQEGVEDPRSHRNEASWFSPPHGSVEHGALEREGARDVSGSPQ